MVPLLGSPQTTARAAPEIVITFKEKWAVPKLRYLGLNAMAFNDDGFYVLNGKNGAVEARIPFETIGDCCEIVCQSGLGSVPLLVDIINFTLLKKNYLPLHASAFQYQGSNILVVGWTKGGKTETLLSFCNHGARYIGDEWVILSSDGQTMFGLPVPVTIWDWQFKYIPKLLPKISKAKQAFFMGIRLLDTWQHTWGYSRLKRLDPFVRLEEAMPAFKRQLKVVELPQVLFAGQFCQTPVSPDKLFLMISQSEPTICIKSCNPLEIAQRMAHSNAVEQFYFFEHYKAFKFAFPNLRNVFLEQVDEQQRSLLAQTLQGKQAYQVLHPYPVSFVDLFENLQPFCQ